MGDVVLLASGFFLWNWLTAMSQRNARLFNALSREALRRGVVTLRATSVQPWVAPIPETLEPWESVTSGIYYPAR